MGENNPLSVPAKIVGKASEILNSAAALLRKNAGSAYVYVKAHARLFTALFIAADILVVVLLVRHLSQPVALQFSVKTAAVNAPLTISFKNPVSPGFSYNITPAVTGHWKVSKNIIGGATKLTFIPSKILATDTKYHIQLSNLKPVLAIAAATTNKKIIVKTEKQPSINFISPAAGGVSVDTAIKVRLGTKNHGIFKLRLESPDAALTSTIPVSSDSQVYTWRFAKPLSQGKSYRFLLKDMNRDADRRTIREISFQTITEPAVVQVEPVGFLYPSKPVVLKFDQDMPPESDKLRFSCPGTGSWLDSKTYRFIPQTLQPAGSCAYTILKGFKSRQGGTIEADRTSQVYSPGYVRILSSSPGGTNRPLNSIIKITFDQPVDHASAQASFKLSPEIPGSFSWQGNSMTFRPGALGYQTAYSFSLGAGIKSIYGLASNKAYNYKFSTAAEIKKLNVPAYKQAFSLSCEEASLRMALAYRGINVSDWDILNKVGYNPKPRDTVTNSWDNPNKMFVGDVNGVLGVTGWGVYGGPIAAASQSYGRPADHIMNISAKQISQAIHSGNPVVLWGITGSKGIIDSWNTSDGPVQTAKNAHVRIVYGVEGTADNPLAFFLHDPIYGGLKWTLSQLNNNMTSGGKLPSQGVVVK